jgi:hypothetical protein
MTASVSDFPGPAGRSSAVSILSGSFALAMAGTYRPRHPERTALYRVLFHHFERFLAEYESRFE